MKVEYKHIAITALYGLIQGGPADVAKSVIDMFIVRCGIVLDPDNIIVTSTNAFRTVSTPCVHDLWTGSMTLALHVADESYTITRDWAEEYDIDITHPDYKTDDWFYESDKCQSYIKWKLLEEEALSVQ